VEPGLYCSGSSWYLALIVQEEAGTWFVLSRKWLPPLLKYLGSAASWFILARKWLRNVLKYTVCVASVYIVKEVAATCLKYPGSAATWFILPRK
jgi:hypothetical protein